MNNSMSKPKGIMNTIKLEMNMDYKIKFYVLLFISLAVVAYLVMNSNAMTQKYELNTIKYEANQQTRQDIAELYQTQIDEVNNRLNIVTGERDTCRNTELARRGGIAVDMKTTQTCTYHGVSGTGIFYDCSNNKVYSCDSLIVNCETYKDCDCPDQNKNCNMYTC